MPVNYQQIHSQVQEFSQALKLRQQALKDKNERAVELLQEYASQSELLKAKVERALAQSGVFRCALPTGETLDGCFPLPTQPLKAILLAADGSQINPSRHSQLDYCEINIGVIQMEVGSGVSPVSAIRSELLEVNKLYTPNGVISEGAVALLRDLNERKILAEIAITLTPPVITLTDGPLELFREPKETPDFEQSLDQYLDVLEQLAATGAATAGYVDKPRSDLLVRLLEVAALKEDELNQAGKKRPFEGLSDIDLLKNSLTVPGDRSAVFGIQSVSAQKFRDKLALHFFFINVGRQGHPWLARVEIPQWVAQDADMLARLHSTLMAQSEIMGNQPFPYLLHRAHEVAVVTLDDQEQLERMIVAELQRQDVALSEISHKQSAKDTPGKKRYGQ